MVAGATLMIAVADERRSTQPRALPGNYLLVRDVPPVHHL
jgi:hypothetical protein